MIAAVTQPGGADLAEGLSQPLRTGLSGSARVGAKAHQLPLDVLVAAFVLAHLLCRTIRQDAAVAQDASMTRSGEPRVLPTGEAHLSATDASRCLELRTGEAQSIRCSSRRIWSGPGLRWCWWCGGG